MNQFIDTDKAAIIRFLDNLNTLIWADSWANTGFRTWSGLPEGISKLRKALPLDSEEYRADPLDTFNRVFEVLRLKKDSSDPKQDDRHPNQFYRGYGRRLPSTREFYTEQYELAEILQYGERVNLYQNSAVFLDYASQESYKKSMGRSPFGPDFNYPMEKSEKKPVRFSRLYSEGFTRCRAILIHEVDSQKYWFFHLDPNQDSYSHFSAREHVDGCDPQLSKLRDRKIEVYIAVSSDSPSYRDQLKDYLKSQGNTIVSLRTHDLAYTRFSVSYNIEDNRLKMGDFYTSITVDDLFSRGEQPAIKKSFTP